MYRKFKPPFFSARSNIAEPASRQAHVRLVKIPVLLRLTWAAQQSVAHEVFQTLPLARTQTERQRSACVGKRFSAPQIVLREIESLRRGARRGAGR